MKCKVTFNIIGLEGITLDLETDQETPLTDLDILKILEKDSEKRNALCDLIHNLLYKQTRISEVTLDSLLYETILEGGKVKKIPKKGLMGNCSVKYLIEQFPEIDFPEGVDANVLLINNLKIGNDRNIYGRRINSNGLELFIVKGTKEDIAKLAGFLRVRQLMEELSFLFSEESNNYKNLEKIRTARNKKKNPVDNIFELMLDFLDKKSNYEDIYIINEGGKQESAYNILQKLSNIILQYSGRIEYSDLFVNTINQHVKHLDNNKKNLSITSLYGAMEVYHPEILESLEIKNKTEFHKFFSLAVSNIKEPLLKVFNNIVEGTEGYATLLTNLFDVEPEFPLIFDSSAPKSIYLKSIPRTLLSKYGIEYDTISSYDIITGKENYKGYKIYAFNEDGVRKYIPSRGYLTEDSLSKIYNTEQEVRDYINSSVEKQDIKKNSFIDFKFRGSAEVDGEIVWESELPSLTVYSRQALTQGSIIESLDIPVNKKTDLYNGDIDLFTLDRLNYSTFKEKVNKWNISEETKNVILSEINNAEKIAVFIYKINELLKEDRSNELVMIDTVNLIKNAGVRDYYIESRTWIPGKGRFKYKVIPTNGIEVENYKKDKTYPIVTLMDKVNQVLSDKFNVPVHMLTSADIKEDFKDINVNTTRAFIREGLIYVNTTLAKSSDLLHEYTHLILGVLKTDKNLRSNYELLLGMVASTKQGLETMKRLYDRYEGLSLMDLMEETFVTLFSNHIMGNLSPEVKTIFQGLEKFLKDATKIIFNNEIEDLSSFYGKTLETVFNRFSSDVSVLLQLEGLDFEHTKTSRLYSDWVSKLILKYNETDGKEGIKEECI